MFSSKEAERRLRKYRKKGLDPMARSMVGYLTREGVAGRDVLEVGGGVGGLHVELLRAGAGRVVNVELSPEYEDSAGELLAEEGLSSRVTRKVMDFADNAHRFEAVDDVVMNRVVCCYDDMPKLMIAAGEKASRRLAITFPRDKWYVRLVMAAGNYWLRRKKVQFQAFVHDPGQIVEHARNAGLEPAFRDHNLVWEALVFERAA